MLLTVITATEASSIPVRDLGDGSTMPSLGLLLRPVLASRKSKPDVAQCQMNHRNLVARILRQATCVGHCIGIMPEVGRIVPFRNLGMLAVRVLEFVAKAGVERQVESSFCIDGAMQNFFLAKLANRYSENWLQGNVGALSGGVGCAA